MNDQREYLNGLFQQEFSRMVAVISKRFGLEHIEIAEDIVSETFLVATESWAIKGLPQNPTAWLYKVAKQKNLYHFRRKKIYDGKIVPELKSRQDDHTNGEEVDFSARNIKDRQLQMLFAICNPAIASEAQIGLALRILCGFGIEEIAEAFLSNKEAINKRLFRAKEKLRSENIRMELPPEPEIAKRLSNVLHVIYLLFSEGYYSKTGNKILRKDLCFEAMRLGLMLTEYEKTNLPVTNALMALMCFHASRFSARQTDENTLVLYEEQNEDLWDAVLIKQGFSFLNLSAQGDELTSYHLEARIASWHCIKEDTPEKWNDILHLYDELLLVNYSPSVALNRVFALHKAGILEHEKVLLEAEKLNFDNNHFYFLLLAELYKDFDNTMALLNFEKAYHLAKTEPEKHGIMQKITGIVSAPG